MHEAAAEGCPDSSLRRCRVRSGDHAPLRLAPDSTCEVWEPLAFLRPCLLCLFFRLSYKPYFLTVRRLSLGEGDVQAPIPSYSGGRAVGTPVRGALGVSAPGPRERACVCSAGAEFFRVTFRVCWALAHWQAGPGLCAEPPIRPHVRSR